MKQSSKRYKNVSLLTDASPRDAGDGAQISSSIPIPKKQKVGYTSNSIASKRYSSASQTSSVSKTSSSLSSSTDSDFIEKHSGIRIKNRLISSIDLDNKLRDVPTVKIPNIKNKVSPKDGTEMIMRK